jgi:hypothetical protein
MYVAAAIIDKVKLPKAHTLSEVQFQLHRGLSVTLCG